MEFEAKLFRLPAGQGGLCGTPKARGASVKLGRGRKNRGLATGCYHWGGGVGVGIIPFGVGRVTESDFLFSESAYFLCRTAWARHALQA